MSHSPHRLLSACALAALAATTAPQLAHAAASADPPARWFSSIVWCVMENHGIRQVNRLGGEQYLIKHGTTFSDYAAVTHPSGPNYRVIASGKKWTQNEVYRHAEPTVATELAALGVPTIDWYIGGHPDLKHDPYVDLKNPITIKPNGPFLPDTLPPAVQVYLGYDDMNNAHNGPLSAVDKNISDLVNTLNRSKWFNTPDAHGKYPVLMVTWDEAYTPDNRVLTGFYGRGVKAGYVSKVPYNHYNMCRTLTDNWNLKPLGDAGQYKPITDVWK